MSQENVEAVRHFLNTFMEVDEGIVDRHQLTQLIAPHATFDLGAFSAVGWRRQVRDLDDFLEFRAAWMEPYDDFSYRAETILDAGAKGVVVTLHQRGKPHGSDAWVEMHYGIVYTVEEGLISRAEFYASPGEALEAAGLRE